MRPGLFLCFSVCLCPRLAHVPPNPTSSTAASLRSSCAFLTASNLSAYVAGLPGANAVAAHSLGNVLVSSAIADHAMPVDTYFMLDAAVAAEAYDVTVTNDSRMVHTWWEDYTNTCWAANWHNLFLHAPGWDILLHVFGLPPRAG